MIPIHDGLEFDHVLVPPNPSVLGLFLLTSIAINLPQSQKSLNGHTLGVLSIGSLFKDPGIQGVVDVLHVFEDNWVHLGYQVSL